MTETAPPPTNQRPRFPRWSHKDQDLWDDTHETYITGLLGREDVKPQDVPRLAAILADESHKERQYRFWIQRKPRTKAARKAAPKRRTHK